MTRNKTSHSTPYALISSTLGTSLVSIFAAWLAASILYVPATARTDAVNATQLHSQSSGHLFQLSPIPPGADWTS
jgi:hypothetical protein